MTGSRGARAVTSRPNPALPARGRGATKSSSARLDAFLQPFAVSPQVTEMTSMSSPCRLKSAVFLVASA